MSLGIGVCMDKNNDRAIYMRVLLYCSVNGYIIAAIEMSLCSLFMVLLDSIKHSQLLPIVYIYGCVLSVWVVL